MSRSILSESSNRSHRLVSQHLGCGLSLYRVDVLRHARMPTSAFHVKRSECQLSSAVCLKNSKDRFGSSPGVDCGRQLPMLGSYKNLRICNCIKG